MGLAGPEKSVGGGARGVSEVAEHQHFARCVRRAALQTKFDRIRAIYDAGKTVTAIARELGLTRRRVDRWLRLIVLPERNSMAPKACTPAYHEAFLSRRWSSSIIGPPSIRRIKPWPLMSFCYQLPSLQHAIMGASVKWVIAAHGRRELFRVRSQAAGQ